VRLLVLGGSDFLGRHVTAAALARGVEVTLFNRGRTNPDLFPQAEKLRGDRGGDLAPLRGRTWDAVVDTCGYFPAQVTASVERLAGAVDRYAFVSSISVYSGFAAPGMDETAPVHEPAPDTVGELSGATYGPLKVACERAVKRRFDGRALIPRLGLLMGPWDNVPRMCYWLWRVARGGSVLAPGAPDRPLQPIDARDAAEWILTALERGTAGTFNTTGAAGTTTLGDLLDACRATTGSDAQFVWASDADLMAAGVAPFDGLPYWLPEPAAPFMQVSVARARDAGLTSRPLAATVRDTWEWLRAEPDEEPPYTRALSGLPFVCGLSREREAEILRMLAPEGVP
jgi:2'-hydroxyisoflavone reductase